MISNKEIDKYIHDISVLMPLSNSESKRFLSDMRKSFETFAEDNPSASIDDLMNDYGSPTNIAYDYIEGMDTEQLIKRLSLMRLVRRGIIGLLVIALLALSIYNAILLRGYNDFKKSIVTNSETVIVEESTNP